jgi:hypothetical protein
MRDASWGQRNLGAVTHCGALEGPEEERLALRRDGVA